MEEFFLRLLESLSLPQYGLSTVFVISFLAATLIPLTPTPFVIGLVKLNPELFWPTIIIASIGNTLGGAVDWWMGYGAKNLHEKITHKDSYGKVMAWLKKFGAKACLFSWLPVVGDPLSVAAGWLKLPFWPCIMYMYVGRFMRFLLVTFLFIWIWPGALDI